jgi:DNA repair exonuclease SbcCD ATPase subunit
MSKYIKVTEKDKPPVVVLAANRAFFTSRGAKIEEPTKKEIESFFPEEKKSGTPDETAQELKKVKAELETARKELESEKTARAAATESHSKENADLKAELETVKTALNEAQKQISKLSKKE